MAASTESPGGKSASPANMYLPPADPFLLILFGATGDLAARKVLPSLFGLWAARLLPQNWAIVGTGRKPLADEEFRNNIVQQLIKFRQGISADQASSFVRHFYYQPTDASSSESFCGLQVRAQSLNDQLQLAGNRLLFLALEPDLFLPVIENAARVGLTTVTGSSWARVVIEKPFGHDLASARALDAAILHHLHPEQIFRIDHYLGKDTVQNIAALRFGNAIFEPLFHRHYVDHVQITMAETIGMEGRRGAYYDQAGALRDVMQNHMLQLLAFAAMEPPATLRAKDITNAKIQTLDSLVPIHGADVQRQVVRGQYSAGQIRGVSVPAYQQEEGIAPNSRSETYVAMRVEIDNWRWAGVPFLLRTGKRLAQRVTEIAVEFKLPPLSLFRTVECEGDHCDLTAAQPNVLVLRIQPNEGISLMFSTKRPGMSLDLHPAELIFDYQQSFNLALPEAYERLIFDALRGDHTLFMRSDELETAWEFITPILHQWQADPSMTLPTYAAGSWGPVEANRLMAGIPGGQWRRG